MTTTTNLSLVLLDVGQKEKEATINGNMAILDAGLPRYLGEFATDPATTGLAKGCTYYNTTSSLTKVLKSTGSWSAMASGSGTLTAVTGTLPIVSSGGAAPVISIAAATGSVDGYLSHTDWNTFNGKQAALGFTPYNATNPSGYTSNLGTVTAVTASGPLSSTGGTTPALSISASSSTVDGYLSHTDWNTFNGKQAALGFTPYNATNPSGFTSNVGTVTSIALSSSSLSITGSPITASGTLGIELSTSGVSAGTYLAPKLTVDTKGRITTASNAAIVTELSLISPLTISANPFGTGNQTGPTITVGSTSDVFKIEVTQQYLMGSANSGATYLSAGIAAIKYNLNLQLDISTRIQQYIYLLPAPLLVGTGNYSSRGVQTLVKTITGLSPGTHTIGFNSNITFLDSTGSNITPSSGTVELSSSWIVTQIA
jgi:hypothetical protein